MLVSVTQAGGTGISAHIPNIQVAGKTGTTKKYDRQLGEYSNEKHLLSFVGFLPAQDPELTLLVILDEPQKQEGIHYSAAPLFKETALAAMRYYRLQENKKRENLQAKK